MSSSPESSDGEYDLIDAAGVLDEPVVADEEVNNDEEDGEIVEELADADGVLEENVDVDEEKEESEADEEEENHQENLDHNSEDVDNEETGEPEVEPGEDRLVWEQNRLHFVTKFEAFRNGLKDVSDWLEEHGEPYLQKNSEIGDNKTQSSHLRLNHLTFQKLAKCIQDIANNVYKAGEDCIISGLFPNENIRDLLHQLEQRMKRFESRMEQRLAVVNQATLFYTHHEELLLWYDKMGRKYSNIRINTSVLECENDNKQCSLESEGTSEAYATTLAEGSQLVKTLEEMSEMNDNGGIQQNVLSRLYIMLAQINERHNELLHLWEKQKPALQFATNLATVLAEVADLAKEMITWENDMQSLVSSDCFFESAEKVLPHHAENEKKIRQAIDKLRLSLNEIIQVMQNHQLDSIQTVEGIAVSNIIQSKMFELDEIEMKATRSASETSRKLEEGRKACLFKEYCKEWQDICDDAEKRLHLVGHALPSNMDDAMRMTNEMTECTDEYETKVKGRVEIYRTKMTEILSANVVNRDIISEWNREVTIALERINLLFCDRRKILKAATDFYKEHNKIVPILDHLEKEYEMSSDTDWCSRLDQSLPLETRVTHLAESISDHLAARERFLKPDQVELPKRENPTHHTSLLFLQHIERCAASSQQKECSQHVTRLKDKMMEQLSKIRELWARKKREMDRCHAYLLLKSSIEKKMGILEHDIERLIATLKEVNGEERTAILMTLKACLMEHKGSIESVLATGELILKESESEMHKGDIERTLRCLKEDYDEVATRVIQVEEEEKKEGLRELLQTERIYIEDLHRCITVYLQTFERMEKEGKVPPLLKGRRDEIFCNVDDLYTFHTEVFLEELLKYENEPDLVGYTFTVYVGAISELYTIYFFQKDIRNNLLLQQETIDFFDRIRESHNLETNNSLESLLMKPVQRVTRYALLMKELFRGTTGEWIRDFQNYEVDKEGSEEKTAKRDLEYIKKFAEEQRAHNEKTFRLAQQQQQRREEEEEQQQQLQQQQQQQAAAAMQGGPYSMSSAELSVQQHAQLLVAAREEQQQEQQQPTPAAIQPPVGVADSIVVLIEEKVEEEMERFQKKAELEEVQKVVEEQEAKDETIERLRALLEIAKLEQKQAEQRERTLRKEHEQNICDFQKNADEVQKECNDELDRRANMIEQLEKGLERKMMELETLKFNCENASTIRECALNQLKNEKLDENGIKKEETKDAQRRVFTIYDTMFSVLLSILWNYMPSFVNFLLFAAWLICRIQLVCNVFATGPNLHDQKQRLDHFIDMATQYVTDSADLVLPSEARPDNARTIVMTRSNGRYGFSYERGFFTRILTGLPAHRSGLQVGDEILAVDDVNVEMMQSDDVFDMIRATDTVKLVVRYNPNRYSAVTACHNCYR